MQIGFIENMMLFVIKILLLMKIVNPFGYRVWHTCYVQRLCSHVGKLLPNFLHAFVGKKYGDIHGLYIGQLVINHMLI